MNETSRLGVLQYPPSPSYCYDISQSKNSESRDTTATTTIAAHSALNKDKKVKRKPHNDLDSPAKRYKSESTSSKTKAIFEEGDRQPIDFIRSSIPPPITPSPQYRPLPVNIMTQASANETSRLEEELKTVYLDLQRAKAAHQRAINQLDLSLEDEKRAHVKEVKSLKLQMARLKTKTEEEKSSEIDLIERELIDLKSSYNLETKDRQRISQTNKNLKKELATLKSSHDELLTKVKELEEQCSQLKTQTQTLNSTLEKQSTTENELRKELSAKRSSDEELLTTLKQLKEQSDQILNATLETRTKTFEQERLLAKVNQLEKENYKLKLSKANFENYFGRDDISKSDESFY